VRAGFALRHLRSKEDRGRESNVITVKKSDGEQTERGKDKSDEGSNDNTKEVRKSWMPDTGSPDPNDQV